MEKRLHLRLGVLALFAMPWMLGCARSAEKGPAHGTRYAPKSVLPFETVACGDGTNDPIDRVTRHRGYAEVATRDIAQHAEERFGGIAPVEDASLACDLANYSILKKRPQLSKLMLEQLRASGRDAALVTSVDTVNGCAESRQLCDERHIRAYAYLFASNGELTAKTYGTWRLAEIPSANEPPSFHRLAEALLDDLPKRTDR